jgi:lipoic acid synthetase
MILGAECSRNCRFCAVPGVATPDPVNPDEPRALALAVAQLGLRYVVITSVTRDDLPDGGASHFADTVLALHNANPEVMIELLIPDFQGKEEAFQTVLTSSPDVVGHNLETIARLTPLVRDARASYNRSLDVLSWFSQHGAITKTSFLCGLGESEEELMESCQQARYAGVAHLALGQYLAPSPHHAPVVRYWTPQEFETFKTHALAMGFQSVASGPLVRSSYRAHDFVGSTLRG